MNGLKTTEFYKTATPGDIFVVDNNPVMSFPFSAGEEVQYMGYDNCHCNYKGCHGKGQFMSLKTHDIKTFCMAWSNNEDTLCQWTHLRPVEIELLPEDLFTL